MLDVQIVACAPPHCKCPELFIKDQAVVIKDDFNGEVNMTLEQWVIMVSKFMTYVAESEAERLAQAPIPPERPEARDLGSI